MFRSAKACSIFLRKATVDMERRISKKTNSVGEGRTGFAAVRDENASNVKKRVTSAPVLSRVVEDSKVASSTQSRPTEAHRAKQPSPSPDSMLNVPQRQKRSSKQDDPDPTDSSPTRCAGNSGSSPVTGAPNVISGHVVSTRPKSLRSSANSSHGDLDYSSSAGGDDSPIVQDAVFKQKGSNITLIPAIAADRSLLGKAESSSFTAGFIGETTSDDEGQSKSLSKRSDFGIPFQDLIDRLLAPQMSKADSRFVTMFLCLYRKFASPSQLFQSIVKRFGKHSSYRRLSLVHLPSQLRLLNVLHEWISHYPGDFAAFPIRTQVVDFLDGLSSQPEFAVALKAVRFHVESNQEDEDATWAWPENHHRHSKSIKSNSSRFPNNTGSSADSPRISVHESTDQRAREFNLASRPANSQSESCRNSVASNSDSFHSYLSVVISARHQAQFLTPTPKYNIDKSQWRLLMEVPDDHIAQELTRIDWLLFSSIRPRDLIRHISLSVEHRTRCHSLEYVNLMINEFNHMAFWVANMILLREKPKHRAQMLEKFMKVAWQLRCLNNYNSLGAIIAGINGTAVHRLSQTRTLVSPDIRKRFMRLEILMGTAKSHSAYRLGWQNTSAPRIPFLPLHRRDLVFAEEGNETFLRNEEGGERINWKKFDIMGDIIVGIKDSQGLPYPEMRHNEDVQRLILHGKFTKDEDKLYERSIFLESPSISENTRRKFNFFQR